MLKVKVDKCRHSFSRLFNNWLNKRSVCLTLTSSTPENRILLTEYFENIWILTFWNEIYASPYYGVTSCRHVFTILWHENSFFFNTKSLWKLHRRSPETRSLDMRAEDYKKREKCQYLLFVCVSLLLCRKYRKYHCLPASRSRN